MKAKLIEVCFSCSLLRRMNSSTRYELVSRLNGDPVFGALKSNSERIAYLLEKVTSFDQLKELVRKNFSKAWDSSRKSSLLANRYYQEADTCFKTERLDAALALGNRTVHGAARNVIHNNSPVGERPLCGRRSVAVSVVL